MWVPKTLQGAYTPILVLRCLFGMHVLEIRGRERLIYTILYNVVCLGTYVLVIALRHDVTNWHWVAYQKLSITFTLWVNVIVAAISVVYAWMYSKRLKQIVRRCAEVDTTLESFGIEKEYGKFFFDILRGVVLWFIFAASLHIADVLWMMDEFDDDQAYFLSMILHMPILFNSLIDYNFMSLIRFIDTRLSKINRYMTEVLEIANVDILDLTKRERSPKIREKIIIPLAYEARKRFIRHLLQTMKQVHLEMVRISREIHHVFNVLILLELGVGFTIIAGSVYNIYFVMITVNAGGPRKDKLIVAMALWALSHSGKILGVCMSCDILLYKVRTMAQIVRGFEGIFTDQEIRDETQQFSLQLVLYPLTFSPCGFMNLSNKFATSIFGTIVTYLVLFVQMSTTPKALKSLVKIVNE